MKVSNKLWREQLVGETSAELTTELDDYESEIELRKQGKIEEKIFTEIRLRRGAYGQRYDNGQRWNGKESQTIQYPSDTIELRKGVSATLPFEDKRDFEEAKKGFIAKPL